MENKKSFIKELIPYVVIIIVVLLVKQYLFSTILVNGTSMETTLYNKDFMILDKISVRLGKLERFDIVVIQTDKEKIIKRIIGLPGEEVEYKNNKLYINDKEVEDNYNSNYTKDFDKVKLGKNEYFVLGDNRLVSVDSRYIGPVSINKILGKTNLVLYPLNRIGFKS